jgi:hypothetical protein
VILPGSESATEVQPTTATLNANVNPEGHPVSYRFEYGTTDAYGSFVEGTMSASGFEGEALEAKLSGLSTRTTYHFRVVATDSERDVRARPDVQHAAATPN